MQVQLKLWYWFTYVRKYHIALTAFKTYEVLAVDEGPAHSESWQVKKIIVPRYLIENDNGGFGYYPQSIFQIIKPKHNVQFA